MTDQRHRWGTGRLTEKVGSCTRADYRSGGYAHTNGILKLESSTRDAKLVRAVPQKIGEILKLWRRRLSRGRRRQDHGHWQGRAISLATEQNSCSVANEIALSDRIVRQDVSVVSDHTRYD
jgi:hypothetical protein